LKKLPLGKVPLKVLQQHILRFKGQTLPDVQVGPRVGIDFAVVRLNDQQHLIVSSDPVTGVDQDIGWYAVNVNANDVATSGAKPMLLDSVILLPEGADENLVQEVAKQIGEAAKEVGMMVIGGHTEVTPGLKRVIVVITAIGVTDRYITAGDAKDGDTVLMTKTAGIEGTSILVRTFRNQLKTVDEETLEKATQMIRQISVVKDAAVLFSTGKVHAMHDATEGGILEAVYEMALASNLGFTLNLKDIPVADETAAICRALKVDPVRLVGSGCLVAAVDSNEIDSVLKELSSNGIRGTVIGRFGSRGKKLVKPDESVEEAEAVVLDELWRLTGNQLDAGIRA
jgi:hydrogenase expression/formation protein HypE